MAYTLTAEDRSNEQSPNAVRAENKIPAVLYGFGVEESKSLSLPYKEFAKIYEQAGESQIVELSIGSGKPVNVLVREVQINPVKRDFIHVDVQAVDISKPVEVEIPLNYIGEAPAVKASGGSLMKKLDTLYARCLPVDLVKAIDVDVSTLQTLEDTILVSTLELPKGIEALTNETDLVATVLPPRIEAEPTPAAAEEAAEGDAPAEGGEDAAAEEKSE